MADYYSLIAGAVSRLPSQTDEARHALYEHARTILQQRLHTLDPPISAAELGNEEVGLEAAISRVESELLFSVMQRFASVEATRSTPISSLVSTVKRFVRKIKSCALTEAVSKDGVRDQKTICRTVSGSF
jgi:hypothetical protein